MDACNWLLDNGVPPDAIRWIRPRDAWILDREYQQPLDLVPRSSKACRAISKRRRRPRTSGPVPPARSLRTARAARPDRRTDDVPVRHGEPGRAGTPAHHRARRPPGPGAAHRDRPRSCSTTARSRPTPATCTSTARPPACVCRRLARSSTHDRITLQQVRTCQPTFNAALIAYVETSRHDADKNRLCPPNPYPTRPSTGSRGPPSPSVPSRVARRARPHGLDGTLRLNAARGIGDRWPTRRCNPRSAASSRTPSRPSPKLQAFQAQARQAGPRAPSGGPDPCQTGNSPLKQSMAGTR